MFSDSIVERVKLIVKRENISEEKFSECFQMIVEIAIEEERQLINNIFSCQALQAAVKKEIGYNVYHKLRAA